MQPLLARSPAHTAKGLLPGGPCSPPGSYSSRPSSVLPALLALKVHRLGAVLGHFKCVGYQPGVRLALVGDPGAKMSINRQVLLRPWFEMVRATMVVGNHKCQVNVWRRFGVAVTARIVRFEHGDSNRQHQVERAIPIIS